MARRRPPLPIRSPLSDAFLLDVTKGSQIVAGPVEQTGVIVACPGCGLDVLQKTMIPLSAVDNVISYSCVECARKLVATVGGEKSS